MLAATGVSTTFVLVLPTSYSFFTFGRNKYILTQALALRGLKASLFEHTGSAPAISDTQVSLRVSEGGCGVSVGVDIAAVRALGW